MVDFIVPLWKNLNNASSSFRGGGGGVPLDNPPPPPPPPNENVINFSIYNAKYTNAKI